MSTHTRNGLLAVGAILVAAIAAWHEAHSQRWGNKPVSTPPTTDGFKPQRRGGMGYTAPMTNYLGQSVPVASIPYLEAGIRCARQVAAEADTFPADSNPHKLLKGLEVKLWNDDYAYAALVGGMSRTNALEAYTNLAQQAVPAEAGPLTSPAPESLAVYYRDLVAMGNGNYSNVLATLSKYAPGDPLASDLFKDGALAAACQAQSDGWITQVQQETDYLTAKQAEQWAKQPEVLTNILAGFTAVQDERVNSFQALQASYQRVFAYRLSQRDGLTDPALIRELSAIRLSNAGPELVIPEVE